MVDPNVLRSVGCDPEEVTGFAFGWALNAYARGATRSTITG